MTFRELVQKQKEPILKRWLADVLATYPGDAPAIFGRTKDRFANPVGNTLRVGTRGILEALLEGEQDDDSLQACLAEIVKLRAVQEFSASQAVGFVFFLKDAVRAELETDLAKGQFAGELRELDGQIDGIALMAFDQFVACREQVCELRVNEMKRRVSWVVKKINERSRTKNGMQSEGKTMNERAEDLP